MITCDSSGQNMYMAFIKDTFSKNVRVELDLDKEKKKSQLLQWVDKETAPFSLWPLKLFHFSPILTCSFIPLWKDTDE